MAGSFPPVAGPLALAPTQYGGLLRATVVIAFHYNLIGTKRTRDQERLYHQLAIQLHRGKVNGLAVVLQALGRSIAAMKPSKEDFREKAAKTNQKPNVNVVRYLLSSGQPGPP